jgi:hypothetical protein
VLRFSSTSRARGRLAVLLVVVVVVVVAVVRARLLLLGLLGLLLLLGLLGLCGLLSTLPLLLLPPPRARLPVLVRAGLLLALAIAVLASRRGVCRVARLLHARLVLPLQRRSRVACMASVFPAVCSSWGVGGEIVLRERVWLTTGNDSHPFH